MRKQGFAFISSEGSYAAVRTSCDHGPTRQVIIWVKDIDDAEVFPHDNIARRKFKELEKAQSLQAVETRIVQFQTWVKPEPVPAAPEDYQPFPPAPPAPDTTAYIMPADVMRPAWENIDCDRRVPVNGVMHYFGDGEVIPAGTVHSQVEYQYGIDAYSRKTSAARQERINNEL